VKVEESFDVPHVIAAVAATTQAADLNSEQPI
jgi:hypothetical protein